jgi:peptidoglycan hydrolase CwlO-like protein
MNHILVKQTMGRPFGIGLLFAFLWIGLSVVPVAAEGETTPKGSAVSSKKNTSLSTDNLQKQINDLDGQIQNLREKSLELQQKTRAKLQAQLDGLKQQRDTLRKTFKKLLKILRPQSIRWKNNPLRDSVLLSSSPIVSCLSRPQI